jgi:glycosyltransferase involved in cell wall biosynthesis
MNDVRIFFFTSGHSPFSARLFFRELQSLKKRYSNLTIIAPNEKEIDFCDGIRVIGIRKRKSRYDRFVTLLDLLRTGLKSRPDLLHCHEPDSLFIGLLIKKLSRNVKVIYDCHEFHPYSFTEDLPKLYAKIFFPVIYSLENYMASQADAVITVNDKLGERFHKKNKNVAILPNYPTLEIFCRSTRSKEVFSEDAISFIYVGGLTAERGLFKMLDMIEVAQRKIKCKLVLIGKFPSDNVKGAFWKTVEDKRLKDMVVYKGYLPHDDIAAHLLDADFGLCLLDSRQRYHWTEPIKYFEYAAAGLPVIMSDLPAMKNLVKKNENGYTISLNSPDEFADTIGAIITDRSKAKRMGQRGQSAFNTRYNWEALEPRLFELYSKIL